MPKKGSALVHKTARKNSKYTPRLGDLVCGSLANGNSVKATAASIGVAAGTIFAWSRQYPEFAEAFRVARHDMADAIADDMLHIVEEEPDVNRAKLKIDARKWIASRQFPAHWGDRIEQKTDATVRIEVVDYKK